MVDSRVLVNNEAINKLIAIRAYEIWENQGRPHGYDLLNWQEAKQEILSCIGNDQASVAQTATEAVPTS
jgi:hypothetical protein